MRKVCGTVILYVYCPYVCFTRKSASIENFGQYKNNLKAKESSFVYAYCMPIFHSCDKMKRQDFAKDCLLGSGGSSVGSVFVKDVTKGMVGGGSERNRTKGLVV